MSGLSIGLSALDVNQRLLDLTGQNVSNANTPGYHRQVADLAMSALGGPVGGGVEITQVNRLIDAPLEQAILGNTGDLQSLNTQFSTLNQVQSQFQTGGSSLDTLLNNLFSQLTRWPPRRATRPSAASCCPPPRP
jgi:flagellar hook-associated protein 1